MGSSLQAFLVAVLGFSANAMASTVDCSLLLLKSEPVQVGSGPHFQLYKILKNEWDISQNKFTSKFKKSIAPAFDEFIQEMVEDEMTLKISKDPVLASLFEEAVKAAEKMSALRIGLETTPQVERKYFLDIYQASWSTLIKHMDTYSHGKLKKLDVPRLLLILKQISSFDESKAEYSFYKIKRSIEGRYSFNEFLYCK